MEQDSKDSAQSSTTSISTTDTVSQPEYKVPGHHSHKHTHTPILSCPVPFCVHAQTTQIFIFVHLPLTCYSSLTELLCLNVKITSFVLTVYPLLCMSLSQAAARLESTYDQDNETVKVLNKGFVGCSVWVSHC